MRLEYLKIVLFSLLCSYAESLQYTLITANSPDCVPYSTENYTVQVQHRNGNDGSSAWRDMNPILESECRTESVLSNLQIEITFTFCNYTLSSIPCEAEGRGCGQLRLVQVNHRGGFCDCWAVARQNGMSSVLSKRNNRLQDIYKISNVDGTILHNYKDSMFDGNCRKSASAVREMVFDVTTTSISPNDSYSASAAVKRPGIYVEENCPVSRTCVEVTFDLQLKPEEENSELDSFDEGVEIAFRTSSLTEWVPLKFYASKPNPRKNISVGDIIDKSCEDRLNCANKTVRIRGYNVEYVIGDTHHVQFNLYGAVINNSCLQFRWLQTVRQKNVSNADKVNLDNVTIVFNSSQRQITLLEDNFDNQIAISRTKWNQRHVSLLHMNDEAHHQNRMAQFGSCIPVFAPINSAGATIISRELSTVCLNPSNTPPAQVSYSLITADSPDCLQYGPAPVQLQYRYNDTDPWITLDTRNKSVHSYTTSLRAEIEFIEFVADLDSILMYRLNNNKYVQFRFVQPEHHGGYCDCWGVTNLKVADKDITEICLKSGHVQHKELSRNSGVFLSERDNKWTCNMNAPLYLQSADMIAEFCQDSASVQREFRLFLRQSSGSCGNVTVIDTDSIKCPMPNRTNCTDKELRVDVSFDLQLIPSNGCDSIDNFDEGIELSYRILTDNGTGEWIPLTFFAGKSNLAISGSEQSSISLTDNILYYNITNISGSFILRGYTVPFVIEEEGHHSVFLCRNESVLQYPLQFRWLQTSSQDDQGVQDIVILDNITITVHNRTRSPQPYTLFKTNFDSQTSTRNSVEGAHLTRDKVYHHKTVDDCKSPVGGGALFFYAQPTNASNSSEDISSHQVIVHVDLQALPSEEEEEVLKLIQGNVKLYGIHQLISNSPNDALKGLDDVLRSNDSSDVSLAAATYLLSAINNQYGNSTVDSSVSEAFFSVANSLLEPSQVGTSSTKGTKSVAGSTLLQVLDSFALNNHNASDESNGTDNIVIRVHDEFYENPIEDEDVEIKIPREVLGIGGLQVRMASFLFRNMSGLLPSSINGTDSKSDSSDKQSVQRLASPVISTSFLCDNCTTSDLKDPVQVTFKLSAYDKALLKNDPNGAVKCVFWKFDDSKQSGAQAVFFPGKWSEEGCETTFTSNMTSCSCNHLTHFAILLSSKPLDLTPEHSLALQTISAIGVSISLVAMALTILVFIYLNCSINRPLYKMRNYIHIQLCVTLGIAQIIFVAGIEPHLGEGKLVGGVPVGCRLVAVLLHYWFLVSFMWMLMEGVVLYVALVRVFVKRHGLYVAAFTMASYGLPLLYVGGLTVPLGFARNEEMRYNQTYDYGYEAACYLNPATSFIWSLIVPVILIFLANIGFFIMAIVIMCKHQRSTDTKKRAKRVRHWLKACISLSMVMGITWIIGFLVTEFEELLFLAYIFTFFVAFQGLSIFVIFVLLSERKRLKDNLGKWWKSKLGESEFLSKHFGERSFATTTTLCTQQVQMSQLGDRDKVVNAFLEEEPSQDENAGTFFDVVFIPAPISSADECNLLMEDAMEKASLTSCNKTCDRRQVINISPSSSEEKTPEPTTQSSLQGCDETLSGDAPASVVVDSCRGLVSGSGSAEKTVKLAAELNVYVDDDVSANNTHQGDET